MRSKFRKLYCTLKQKFPEFNWFILKAYSKEFGEYYQIWAEKGSSIYYVEWYLKKDGYPSIAKMVKDAEYQLEPYLIEIKKRR